MLVMWSPSVELARILPLYTKCFIFFWDGLQLFFKLCSIIYPLVHASDVIPKCRTGKDSATIEKMLHCLLRWLGPQLSWHKAQYRGELHFTWLQSFGIKVSEHYKELDAVAQGFESNEFSWSNKGVCCMFRWLFTNIKVPSRSETGNFKTYFSGHYQTYGINVQAACDHECSLFMLPLLHLEEWMILQHLKNAIQLDNSKVTSQKACYQWQCICLLLDSTNPICSFGKDEPAKDAFNFYLSQSRIHIQQTFGIMTTKQPLQVCLKHFGKIFMCITIYITLY